MLRGMAGRRGGEDEFRWRGQDVWRVEGLTDAVFAFAVTLLVVSLEVPESFDDLLVTMEGFFSFAVSFAILLWIWYEHYKFFRRYGLRDVTTIWINAVLLFIVLFFVYPLKFLFTMLAGQIFGFAGSENMISTSQGPALMAIYGAGFIAVQLVFAVFYRRAHGMRETLELTSAEVRITRSEFRGFLLNALVGLISIAVAVIGGPGWTAWAGWTYVLIWPAQILNQRISNSRVDAPLTGERSKDT